MHNRPNGAPKLRPITVSDIFESLRAGLADFRAAPVPGLFFANFYVLGGLVMTWITYITGSTFWLVLAVMGFTLIGAFAALGLYETSRRRAASAAYQLARNCNSRMGAQRRPTPVARRDPRDPVPVLVFPRTYDLCAVFGPDAHDKRAHLHGGLFLWQRFENARFWHSHRRRLRQPYLRAIRPWDADVPRPRRGFRDSDDHVIQGRLRPARHLSDLGDLHRDHHACRNDPRLPWPLRSPPHLGACHVAPL